LTNQNNSKRFARDGHLRWVWVKDLHVEPSAQRDWRKGHSAAIAAEFDPDKFGIPLVSDRDGKLYVIDGQHRIEALRLMGWGDQQVQCWVYEGLTIAEEADRFLGHSTTKNIQSFDKFRIAVTAGYQVECDINRIVLMQGLKVSRSGNGAVAATESLKRVYKLGPDVLAKTLHIVAESYGDAGLQGFVIDGIGLLCGRYNGDLESQAATDRLGSVRGGLAALETKAYSLRKQLGASMPQCVAGAATDIINSGRGGKKLANWWAT
jgi:hypothetical protein